MRKVLFVLLVLFCSLLLSVDCCVCAPDNSSVTPVLSIDHATTESWLCERTYNSDLNLPRTLGELNSSQEAPVSLRGGGSAPSLLAFRMAAQLHSEGIHRFLTQLSYPSFAAGPRAVDYYVYCLRRLII